MLFLRRVHHLKSGDLDCLIYFFLIYEWNFQDTYQSPFFQCMKNLVEHREKLECSNKKHETKIFNWAFLAWGAERSRDIITLYTQTVNKRASFTSILLFDNKARRQTLLCCKSLLIGHRLLFSSLKDYLRLLDLCKFG